MNKYLIGTIAVVLALGAGFFALTHKSAPGNTGADYKSGTYTIDGTAVTLVNGKAETETAPDSASKTTTQYFGNESTGDLNGDGTADVAFLLTQNSGGSGTFFYAVAAIKTADGYKGTNAVLIGDRVAPQNTEIHDGKIVVNYADRKPGEPMTAQPSVGKSLILKLNSSTLKLETVASGFEAGSDVGVGDASGPEQDTSIETVKLNQSFTALASTVTPTAVTEDSRCPQGVQCIWAGTVKVAAHIKSNLGAYDYTFELGKPLEREGERITLTEVSPAKGSGQIAATSYQLTFEIQSI